MYIYLINIYFVLKLNEYKKCSKWNSRVVFIFIENQKTKLFYYNITE